MLFVVIFIVCSIFSDTSTAVLEIIRPCRTPNGLKGTCVSLHECQNFREISENGTLEQLRLMKKSICGYDTEYKHLFCCESDVNVNKINISQSSGNKFYDRQTGANQENVTPIESTIGAKVNETSCRTPNGEQTKCISIRQCPLLLSILTQNITTEQKRFLQNSKCGYQGGPLVCCGSDVNYKVDEDIIENRNFAPSSLIPDSCGFQLPNRIFGGADTHLTEFPWMVLLEYEDSKGDRHTSCGGSLISSRYILTAGHCLTGRILLSSGIKLVNVRLGDWDSRNMGRDCVTKSNVTVCNDGVINAGIESFSFHPKYNNSAKERYHDIGLIRLDRDIKFTDFIRPICLPNPNDQLLPGERLLVAGWGLKDYHEESSIKLKVEVPIIPTSQCSLIFERSQIVGGLGRGQVCAGGEAGKDSCAGDSGGPLMRAAKSEMSSRWYIEGIVSFGTGGCGNSKNYGVYTRVSEYVGWIHKTVKP